MKRGKHFRTESLVTYFFVFAIIGASMGLLYFIDGGLTGLVIDGQSNQVDFDEGTYNQTIYNGSALVLSGTNLSGDYISKVFDASGPASWDHVNLSRNLPALIELFAVDGSGGVFISSNSGVTWNEQNDNYGGGTNLEGMVSDSNGNLYILFNQDVYQSVDSGVTWVKVNDDFNPSDGNNGMVIEINSTNAIFAIDGSGDVWYSLDSGTSFIIAGDFNSGANNNAKGIAIDSSDSIFIVDASGSVWKSADSGVTWNEQNDSYGGGSGTDDMVVDSSGNLYILFNREVYKSTDQGVKWNIINDSFSDDQDGLRMISDSNDNLFIIDPSGDVFQSTDSGVTWLNVGDFNAGASNDIKGFTSVSQLTNITFQVRNCSLSNCGDGSFVGPDGTASTFYPNLLNIINLQSRYLQYKIYFSSGSTSINPQLFNVTIDYTILNSAPNIIIFEPQNTLYTNNESLDLKFVASDSDDNLDSCWYTLDGGVTNTTIASCLNTTFSVADSNSYILIMYVNDTNGLMSSDSVDFNVDSVGVQLTILEPVGTKTSRTGIPIDYIAIGDNLTCWYNVKTSIGGGIIGNTTITDCLNSTFAVSSDGDYILNLFANNTLTASNSTSSPFTVTTSSGGGDSGSGGSTSSSGGGGGGGGGTTIIQQTPATQETKQLTVDSISGFVTDLGERKIVSWKVKNTGNVFLNECLFEGFGDYVSWINGGEEKNLAAGEEYVFTFDVNVPENVDSGSYDLGVVLTCKETSDFTRFNVEIIEKKLRLDLVEVIRENENVKVNYILEELSGISQDVELEFLLFRGNDKVAEAVESKSISSNSRNELESFINIDSSLEGNLNLLINLNSETYSTFVQENVILSGTPITGFATFDNLIGGDSIISYVMIFFFLIFAVVVIRRIFIFRKKIKSRGKKVVKIAKVKKFKKREKGFWFRFKKFMKGRKVRKK